MLSDLEEVPGNPRVDDKDDAVNLGNVAGIMHADGVDYANVNERLDGKGGFRSRCNPSCYMSTLIDSAL